MFGGFFDRLFGRSSLLEAQQLLQLQQTPREFQWQQQRITIPAGGSLQDYVSSLETRMGTIINMHGELEEVAGIYSSRLGVPGRTRCDYCGCDREPEAVCPGCGAPMAR